MEEIEDEEKDGANLLRFSFETFVLLGSLVVIVVEVEVLLLFDR